MERVSVDDVEHRDHPMPDTPGFRPLGDALGATDLAMNYYELAPGEGLSGGPHTHMDQEELFYVVEGEVTFEVGDNVAERSEATDDASGDTGAGSRVAERSEATDDASDVAVDRDEVALGPGEAVRFPPGEIQHGYNAGDGRARVLALGAPADSEDIRSPGPCPACGTAVLLEVSVAGDGSGVTIDCPACDETTDL